MSEVVDEFDPNSPEEILNLLSDGCRDCKLAQFTVMLAMAFESSTGGAMPVIKSINESCPGYQYADGNSDTRIETVETIQGLGFALMDFEDPGCPHLGTRASAES